MTSFTRDLPAQSRAARAGNPGSASSRRPCGLSRGGRAGPISVGRRVAPPAALRRHAGGWSPECPEPLRRHLGRAGQGSASTNGSIRGRSCPATRPRTAPVYASQDEGWIANGTGWILAGYIEDRSGMLRPQTPAELTQCVGCHSGNARDPERQYERFTSGVGATVDSTWAFPRQLTGSRIARSRCTVSGATRRLSTIRMARPMTLVNGLPTGRSTPARRALPMMLVSARH